MDGRAAIITGGSLGLGRAMAMEFANSGAKVAIVARRADVLEEAKTDIEAAVPGAMVGAYACDMSDVAAIKDMHQSVVEDLGPLDVVVNNAGTSRAMDFMEISDELWNEDLELKLMGAVRLIRLTFPGMKERRWGRIINVLNVGAKAPRPGGAPTAVSRAAGMALTKVLAGEGAPHNVLVNAMLVGLIESDQHLQRHLKSGSNDTLEEFYDKLGEAVPMGRVGKAEEFANMACFLASDAGSYITGTAINVDGNRAPVV
ncbi:MAG: SDR family oxidoreductase [Alphaproteobacteria bacterium]|jgi:NAD(P)-dependent dehydrogenase (short-subunit alcohol dehydrogenase family)|nr:SDR family oxidoreductase [Alphaproteobacteria bacterium]MDP6832691.1 SDR family oxidoreductase [Alphaproteobacteria bacterium]MDP6876087.1 SDR family oxidoreductase [Alphaproteobacteria bacterium]